MTMYVCTQQSSRRCEINCGIVCSSAFFIPLSVSICVQIDFILVTKKRFMHRDFVVCVDFFSFLLRLFILFVKHFVRLVFFISWGKTFLFITSSCSVNQCNNRNNSLIRVSASVISLPCSFNLTEYVSLSPLLSRLFGPWLIWAVSLRKCVWVFLIKLNLFHCLSNWKRTKQFVVRQFFYSPRFHFCTLFLLVFEEK